MSCSFNQTLEWIRNPDDSFELDIRNFAKKGDPHNGQMGRRRNVRSDEYNDWMIDVIHLRNGGVIIDKAKFRFSNGEYTHMGPVDPP